MNLTDDMVLKFQKGSPLLFEDICAIRSPKLGEVVDVGYANFGKYIQVLMLEKPLVEEDSEMGKLIDELTTFQYFLLICQVDEDVNRIAKEAFKFFTGDDVVFSIEPAQIVFGNLDEERVMGEEQFFDFRRLIKRICFLEVDEKEIIVYKDDSPAVKALKKQMMRNRERVAKAKAKKNSQSSAGDGIELSDLIGSLPFGNCGLNMENIWNITYYSFRDQVKRMGWHETFDINQRAALAGAKIKKSQLKHWIKAISSEDKSD